MSMTERVCHFCDGTGYDPKNYAEICEHCDGEGIIVQRKTSEIHKYRDSGYSHEMKKKSAKNQHKVKAREKQINKYGSE